MAAIAPAVMVGLVGVVVGVIDVAVRGVRLVRHVPAAGFRPRARRPRARAGSSRVADWDSTARRIGAARFFGCGLIEFSARLVC